MSLINVDKVDPNTGTTLELGTSGDTISIPSGVTIANSGTATGFGVSLANGVDNRVVTSSSATALNGEANFTYDGTTALIDGGTGAAGIYNALKLKHTNSTTGGDGVALEFDGEYSNNPWKLAKITAKTSGSAYGGDMEIYTKPEDGSQGGALTKILELTGDGRGKSVFTGLAWAHFDGTGTPAIDASHNVSSVSDSETGQMRVNFTANMADANYAAVVNSWWGYAYTGGAMDIYVDGFKATTSNGSSYTDVNSIMVSVFGNP
jgi:hypothetical protein